MDEKDDILDRPPPVVLPFLLLPPNTTSFPPNRETHSPSTQPSPPDPSPFHSASPLRPRPLHSAYADAPSAQPRCRRSPAPPSSLAHRPRPLQPPQSSCHCHPPQHPHPARSADRSPSLTPSLGASSSSGRGTPALAFSSAPSGCLRTLPELDVLLTPAVSLDSTLLPILLGRTGQSSENREVQGCGRDSGPPRHF